LQGVKLHGVFGRVMKNESEKIEVQNNVEAFREFTEKGL